MEKSKVNRDEEIKEFLEFYQGQQIPSPEHEPIRFAAFVRNFKYYKSRGISVSQVP
jgi:hypothetical protein